MDIYEENCKLLLSLTIDYQSVTTKQANLQAKDC